MSQSVQRQSLGENKAFVDFMLATRDDPRLRDMVAQLLSVEPSRRKPVIDRLLVRLRASGAPPQVLSAIGALQDEAVAIAAAQYIASPP